jgi:hypothetical protein
MLSVVLSGWLASTRLRTFDATVLGVHMGPIDLLFTISAIVIVGAGTYARFALPKVTSEAAAETPTPAPAGEEAGTLGAAP